MLQKMVFGIFVVLMCGCGTTSSVKQFSYEPMKNADDVLIYIYRIKHFVGAAVWWPTSFDGKEVAHLKQGAYYVIRTTPGEHTLETANGKLFTSNGDHKKSAVMFLPGEYFIRFKGPNGSFLTKEEALAEISKMKYDSGM